MFLAPHYLNQVFFIGAEVDGCISDDDIDGCIDGGIGGDDVSVNFDEDGNDCGNDGDVGDGVCCNGAAGSIDESDVT